jgi:hypothetical protein
LLAWGVITRTKVRFNHGGKELEEIIEALDGTKRQHAKDAIKKKISSIHRKGILGAMFLTIGCILQIVEAVFI